MSIKQTFIILNHAVMSVHKHPHLMCLNYYSHRVAKHHGGDQFGLMLNPFIKKYQKILTFAVSVVYGFSSPPGTWYFCTVASTSRTNPTMELYSLSASPNVALNWLCASIRPCISSMVWTMNMSTRSSRVPSSQLLNGCQCQHIKQINVCTGMQIIILKM